MVFLPFLKSEIFAYFRRGYLSGSFIREDMVCVFYDLLQSVFKLIKGWVFFPSTTKQKAVCFKKNSPFFFSSKKTRIFIKSSEWLSCNAVKGEKYTPFELGYFSVGNHRLEIQKFKIYFHRLTPCMSVIFVRKSKETKRFIDSRK